VNTGGKVVLISSTAQVYLSLQAKQIIGLQVQKPSKHAPQGAEPWTLTCRESSRQDHSSRHNYIKCPTKKKDGTIWLNKMKLLNTALAKKLRWHSP
jgi:hypothetical protein